MLDPVEVAWPAAPGGGGRPLPGRGLRRPTGRTAWGEAVETRTGAGAGSKETPPGRRRHVFFFPGVPKAAPGEREPTRARGPLLPKSPGTALHTRPVQRSSSVGRGGPVHKSPGFLSLYRWRRLRETEARREPMAEEGGREQRNLGGGTETGAGVMGNKPYPAAPLPRLGAWVLV